MNENDIMVDEEMNETVDNAVDEINEANVGAGMVILGVAAILAIGAVSVSRTKWAKEKIKEIRISHAQKVLDKYAKTNSDDSDETIKVDHVVVEDVQN